MNNLINIIDTPLKNADDDKLNTRKYVEGLAQYLSKSAMPTTVAIQGQWGSGKTSFMNLLRSILCEDITSGNDREPVYYGGENFLKERQAESSLLSKMPNLMIEINGRNSSTG